MPPWSEAELVHKIRSAGNAQHSEVRGYLLGDLKGAPHPACSHLPPGAEKGRKAVDLPAKPKFLPIVLARLAAKAKGIGDVVAFLGDRSPVPVEGETSASILRRLYPVGSGEKVIIFSDMRSQGQLLWEANCAERYREDRFPAGPEGVWFLPQPVSGEFLPNPRMDGKLSRRSEEAVTAWRYMVLESDQADAEQWLRCLIQMPLRIACICESGGRSIHALVRLDAVSKADWDTKVRSIKAALITLGADAGALSAVRLTRLPQAKRGDRLQRLLYLNPASNGRPILAGKTAMKGTQ